MKQIALILCVLLSLSVKSQDITLYLKNMDSTSIIVKIKGYDRRIHLPPRSMDSIKLNDLNVNPAYEIQSMYGIFGIKESSGMLLVPGRYILVFMWNTKLDAWKTSPLRQFDSETDKFK